MKAEPMPEIVGRRVVYVAQTRRKNGEWVDYARSVRQRKDGVHAWAIGNLALVNRTPENFRIVKRTMIDEVA